jgi:hypothetical protein
MNWKITLGILFIVFTTLSIIYSNKGLYTYNKEIEITVYEKSKNSFGEVSTSSYQQPIVAPYQANYAAPGGAIAFAILGAAALIGMVLLIRQPDRVEQLTNQVG